MYMHSCTQYFKCFPYKGDACADNQDMFTATKVYFRLLYPFENKKKSPNPLSQAQEKNPPAYPPCLYNNCDVTSIDAVISTSFFRLFCTFRWQ